MKPTINNIDPNESFDETKPTINNIHPNESFDETKSIINNIDSNETDDPQYRSKRITRRKEIDDQRYRPADPVKLEDFRKASIESSIDLSNKCIDIDLSNSICRDDQGNPP